ncbi:hypothetical protein ACQKWADRAFT_94127 [Trichoderma austrokoningii]
MPGKNERCYLSALAPELVDNILIHLDSIRTLSNFVAASRFIYQRFTGRRELLILGVLQNQLGPVLADARFLSRLSYATPGSAPRECILYWDKMYDMAAVYKDLLYRGGDDTDLGFAALTQQCHTLYQINFISDAYIAAQGRWLQAQGLVFSPPSPSERLRVLRAFYRRQIICNAWAPTRREPQWMAQDLAVFSNTSGDHGRLGILAPLQPWELQQIDHVDLFVTRLCLSLCLAGDEQGQPVDEAKFGEIFTHTDCLLRYVREHPAIADTAFSAVTSLLHSNNGAILNIAPLYSRFADRYSLLCLQYAWQTHRFDSLPDPTRDQRGEQQQQQQQQEQQDGTIARIDFIGDSVDLVPFGWVDAVQGRYVNWFGNALINAIPWAEPDEAYMQYNRTLELWRSTGFAIWDHQRVEAIKKLDQLSALQTGWAIHE